MPGSYRFRINRGVAQHLRPEHFEAALSKFGAVVYCRTHWHFDNSDDNVPTYIFDIGFATKAEADKAYIAVHSGAVAVDGVVVDTDGRGVEWGGTPEPSPRCEGGQPSLWSTDAVLEEQVVPSAPERGQSDSKRKELSRRLCCRAVLTILLTCGIVVVGIVLRPPEIDTNFDSFYQADVSASIKRDGFLAALNEDPSLSGDSNDKNATARRLSVVSTVGKRFDITIAYEIDEDEEGAPVTLLSSSVLQRIRAFEQSLRNLPSMTQFCKDSYDATKCDPGYSLPTYLRPDAQRKNEEDIVPSSLDYQSHEGMEVPLPLLLYTVEHFGLEDDLLPTSYDISKPGAPLKSFRTLIRYDFICCSTDAPKSEQHAWTRKINSDWRTALKNEIVPFFEDAVQNESWELNGIGITWGGSDLYYVQVMALVMNDIRLAAGSVTFVFFYIMFHTWSLTLSLAGLITVSLAVPLAYVGFAFIADTTMMNVACILSLFLTLGLGSDMIFVYTDFWHTSKEYCKNDSERLSWTYKQALKATLATTSATALSFFANIVSVLKELRSFGFFMGLCVMLVWCLVPLIYMPACALDEWYGAMPKGMKRISCQRLPGLPHRKLAFHVQRFRWLYCLLPAMLLIVLLLVALVNARTSTDALKLLPDDHVLQRSTDVFGKFMQVADLGVQPPRLKSKVCHADDFESGDWCDLHWCDAGQNLETTPSDRSKCLCHRRPKACPSWLKDHRPFGASVRLRIIGGSQVSTDSFESSIREYIVGTSNVMDNMTVMLEKQVRAKVKIKPTQSSLLLDDWLNGEMLLEPMTVVTSTLHLNGSYGGMCGWDDLCFCGALSCNLEHLRHGKSFAWEANVGSAGITEDWKQYRLNLHPVAPSSRRLATTASAPTPAKQRVTVSVVFGLALSANRPLLGPRGEEGVWVFSNDFQASSPWVQRLTRALCTDGPDELLILGTECWIDEFAKSMIRKGLPFPLQPQVFESYVGPFAATHYMRRINQAAQYRNAGRYLWRQDGITKAYYIPFSVDVDYFVSWDRGLEYMKKWDDRIDQVVKKGYISRGDIFPISTLAVRVELQRELASSMILTIGIVIGVGFVVVLLFTRSFALSFYVVLATLGVLSGLFFLIVIAMDSALGPVEIIALIIFIGYSVTYSLHVAHHYGSDTALDEQILAELDARTKDRSEGPTAIARRSLHQERVARVFFALQCIGRANMGSALTTIGCAFFLLFCKLAIFWKLGIVAITVSLLSLFISIVCLPAVLLAIGPTSPGNTFRFIGVMGKTALKGVASDAASLWDEVSGVEGELAEPEGEAEPARSPLETSPQRSVSPRSEQGFEHYDNGPTSPAPIAPTNFLQPKPDQDIFTNGVAEEEIQYGVAIAL